jgi:hypothetical protein
MAAVPYPRTGKFTPPKKNIARLHILREPGDGDFLVGVLPFACGILPCHVPE